MGEFNKQEQFNTAVVQYLQQTQELEKDSEESVGGGVGFIYPVTNSSTTVGQSSTNVVTSTQQWSYFRGVTQGSDIWCSAGEPAVVGEGMKVSSSTSDTPLELKEPSITAKALNCITESTSTLSWTRY